MMDAALRRTFRKWSALVVDDEPFIVEVIGEAMRDAGELFKETVQRLAREYSLVQGFGSGKSKGRQPGTLDSLPPALRKVAS